MNLPQVASKKKTSGPFCCVYPSVFYPPIFFFVGGVECRLDWEAKRGQNTNPRPWPMDRVWDLCMEISYVWCFKRYFHGMHNKYVFIVCYNQHKHTTKTYFWSIRHTNFLPLHAFLNLESFPLLCLIYLVLVFFKKRNHVMFNHVFYSTTFRIQKQCSHGTNVLLSSGVSVIQKFVFKTVKQQRILVRLHCLFDQKVSAKKLLLLLVWSVTDLKQTPKYKQKKK